MHLFCFVESFEAAKDEEMESEAAGDGLRWGGAPGEFFIHNILRPVMGCNCSNLCSETT